MNKIVVVSGPVIIENDAVLLDQHGDDDFWKFCGGTVTDFNHTLIENAQQRALEEMGIKIEITNQAPFFFYNHKKIPAEGRIDIIVAHYLAKKIGDIKPGQGIREWKWIPISELDELAKQGRLAPSILPALKHFDII